MNLWLRNFILLALMLAASGMAVALRPTHRVVDDGPKVNLETMIPKQFGDWAVDEKVAYEQVSPDVKEALDKIYTAVLTRTYINSQGYRVMLSIAYGDDQTDGLAAHDPEGCYPAQGFHIESKSREILHTSSGDIPVHRMEAAAINRHEPVTYWLTVGNQAVNSDFGRKMAQARYAFRGDIPDGLLFRASSIDVDTQQAYRIQGVFIEDLLLALPPESRVRISGLTK